MRKVYVQSDLHLNFIVDGADFKVAVHDAYLSCTTQSQKEVLYKELFFEHTTRMLPQGSHVEDILVLAGDVWEEHKEFSYKGLSWTGEVAKNWHAVLIIAGNHCLSEDTEVLTQRGWKRYEEVSTEDLVLQINPETDICSYGKVYKKLVKETTEGLITLDTPSFSMSVTPQHRCLLRNKKTAKLSYTIAEDLPRDFRVPVTSMTKFEEDERFSDDLLRMFGWVLSDGCISTSAKGHTRIHISQSKPGDDIEELLCRLGWDYSKSTRERAITHVCGKLLKQPPHLERVYRLKAKTRDYVMGFLKTKRVVPEWAYHLSERQFNILLKGIISGNGVYAASGAGKDTSGAIHGRKEFLESLQAVAVTKGVAANLSLVRGKDWKLNFCCRGDWSCSQSNTELKRGVGGSKIVWCLNTEYSNFMVRRNGKPHFTGNCLWHSNISTWATKASKHLGNLQLPNVYVLENNIWEDRDTNTVFVGATFWTDMDKGSPMVKMCAPSVMVPDFKYIKWGPEYGKFTPEKWEREHYKAKRYIELVAKANADKNVVVVTHHLPSYLLCDGKWEGHSSNHYYASSCEGFILDNQNISHWISGHTHASKDLYIGECRCIVNPYGYSFANDRKEYTGWEQDKYFMIGESE